MQSDQTLDCLIPLCHRCWYTSARSACCCKFIQQFMITLISCNLCSKWCVFAKHLEPISTRYVLHYRRGSWEMRWWGTATVLIVEKHGQLITWLAQQIYKHTIEPGTFFSMILTLILYVVNGQLIPHVLCGTYSIARIFRGVKISWMD